MVPKFMTEDPMDSATYFFRRAATHLNRALVNADLVGQDQSVVMRALCLWNTVVEPQQRCWVARTSQLQRLAIWPVLNDYFDVIQFVSKVFGQFVECLSYEMFKGLPIHTSIL